MNLMRFAILFCSCSLIGLAESNGAGTLILSGDGTPVFSLTADTPVIASAGNRQFFSNILGDGTSVAVLNTSFNFYSGREIDAFYDGFPGVSSTLYYEPVTAAQLQGVDLFLLPIPSARFARTETLAIANFLKGGGTIFLMGESDGISFGPTTNGYIRGLLTALGSNLDLIDTTHDIGTQHVQGAAIANHPLNSGVSNLVYGSASEVAGGVPLLFTKDHTPFVAVESLIIPEPPCIWLYAYAFAVSMVLSRCRVGERSDW